jgi:hypothetical protein
MTNVDSGGAAASTSAQAGGSFASELRRKPAPICAAEAPSSKAAATPRASAMPPIAITGKLHRVDHRRQQREQTDLRRLGHSGVERAAMAARFHALRDDRVGAGGLGGFCLGDRRDGGEPSDPLGLRAPNIT